ncbi:MAG: hypothetical protein DRJ05_12040 [Bacteroidetes bacterium]|nr:MAG: hypothetical protein DRJ05_12040 [Bacteroidota bacterium]
MNKHFLIDTGFWIALFFQEDDYHAEASYIYDKIKNGKLIIPWPTLYETLRTKFVKSPNKLKQLQKIFGYNNTFKLSDDKFKESALENSFNDNIKYNHNKSLVDSLLLEILKDTNIKVDYLISFDKRAKFEIICNKRRIFLINQDTYQQIPTL